MQQAERKRVVITGCGLVTPAGNELGAFWRTLMNGTCCLRPLRHFVCAGFEGVLGGEVELSAEDDLPQAVDENAWRGRCAQLALAAAHRAIESAGVGSAELARAGLVLGTTLGEERQIGWLDDQLAAGHGDAIDPGFFARNDNYRLAALVAAKHGLEGPVLLNATACSSGNASVAWASDYIASGGADIMLAGGADTLTRVTYTGFARMGALSQNGCRPFDKRRDGVSFGEGAGILVLEELEHARRRGAKIFAELSGYGISNDAYHPTAPAPNGEGFTRAMQQALRVTGTSPEQVDYVNAHGTGSLYNDRGEMQAMARVFGSNASRVPISSIKSMLGHTNGAAGAIETIACALSLQHQAVPPTANLLDPETEFSLDFVPGKGRAMQLGTCLSLGAGFGGFNVCLVIARAP